MKTAYNGLLAIAMVALFVVMLPTKSVAQHTLTLTGGTGVATARFYPSEETKWMWGSETFGLSWRFYSEKPRFVGAVALGSFSGLERLMVMSISPYSESYFQRISLRMR